ncbi:MAG: glutathione S-transferase [Hyphomicrobiales bacterium]|jgi:glutathione S-transferase|nr:glutathione S-transferase [Hyphomicrobiales bacterium]
MPALEIIGAPQSNYVWAVRMVCAEKGVPYDLNPARPHSPDVDALHPFGKIPVMRHGDVTLCESKAIATYIDRVFDGPKVIPDDPRLAAQVEQWVSLGNVEFDRLMMRQYVVGYAFPKEPGKPDMAAIGAAAEKMKPQIAVLDKAVASGHLVGDSLTLADINILPMLFYVNRFEEGKAQLSAARNLSAYMERHFARPSFQASKPPPPKQ